MKTTPDRLLSHLVLTICVALFIAGCATTAPLMKIDFQELSFELPGTGWKRRAEESPSRITFQRKYGEHRSQNIGIWPVGVPLALRGLSQEEHASKYFDGERNLPRYEGRWEGFIEGERETSGRVYPTMSLRTVYDDQRITVDGLFLLYFPEDFEERQRFYVLFWIDIHPTNKESKGFNDLDVLVASFQARPLGAPGQAPAPVQPRAEMAEPLVTPASTRWESPELKVLSSTKLILGVPFISWGEAARLAYYDKDILNPSVAASLGMILKYWGQDLKLLKEPDKALPEGPGGWGRVESGEGKSRRKSFKDLKRFIDRGIPVLVSPAITPHGHALSPTVLVLAGLGLDFPQIKDEGVCSGVLGRMVSLETFRELEAQLQGRMKELLWESVLQSNRTVIGYDDKQKIVILHDPSFGPAWQVSFDDFDKMWQPTKRWYLAAYPPNHTEVLATRPPAAPYAPRTPNQQAAKQFVFGYALSCVGRMVEAEEQFLRGLAVPGIGKGYQHLLLFELAQQFGLRGNTAQAIAAAQKATELLPEHHRPWEFLAQFYGSSFIEGWQKKAAEAERKAKELQSNSEALRIVAEAIPRDFYWNR